MMIESMLFTVIWSVKKCKLSCVCRKLLEYTICLDCVTCLALKLLDRLGISTEFYSFEHSRGYLNILFIENII